MWLVAFSLYLFALGFGEAFIGFVISAELVAHGAMAFPAGIIGDAFGRKKSFIAASLIKIGVGVTILFTVDAVALVGLSVLIGAGDSFHGVVGSPFMMENSSPSERVHLFSASAILSTTSAMAGAFLGGAVPGLLAGVSFAPSEVGGHSHIIFPPLAIAPGAMDPIEALRFTLLMVAPLTLIALVPLWRIHEGDVGLGDLRARDVLLLRHVKSHRTIFWLAFAGGIGALGFGLFGPLLNLYFASQFHATVNEIGVVVALASASVVVSFFAAPALVGRWGKVNAQVATQLVSVPFLAAIALAPTLWVAALFVLVRQGLARMASPIGSMFAMEMVAPSERATTAGVTHAAFDLPSGMAVGIAGVWFAAGWVSLPFLVAAALYVVAALLYGVVFLPRERAMRAPPRAPPASR
jgi:MFS family permease